MIYVHHCTNTLQSGTITVVRPDLIDYEAVSQFDLIVTATDLVVPANERRQVSEMQATSCGYIRNVVLDGIDC